MLYGLLLHCLLNKYSLEKYMGSCRYTNDIVMTVIGGGVIGLAIGNALSLYLGEENVCVLEKHAQFGTEQSGRSSEVLHAGLYYEGLKAKLCVEGNRLLREFCKKQDVPLLECGKLVVAVNEQEEGTLDQLLLHAERNEVEGLKLLTSRQISERESNIIARTALSSSTTGVIDSATYVQRLVSLNKYAGTILLPSHTVTNIGAEDDCFVVSITTPSETYTFSTRYLINSAGLYADDVARMINSENVYEIMPVKGEYVEFRCRESCAVRSNIYPVPWSFEHQGRIYYDLGVHLTPLVDRKTVRIGPAISPALRKNDYRFSKGAAFFHEKITSFFPVIKIDDLKEGHVGVLSEEKTHYDFVIERDARFAQCIHLVGMESPGLTASLAVAQHVLKMFREYDY